MIPVALINAPFVVMGAAGWVMWRRVLRPRRLTPARVMRHLWRHERVVTVIAAVWVAVTLAAFVRVRSYDRRHPDAMFAGLGTILFSWLLVGVTCAASACTTATAWAASRWPRWARPIRATTASVMVGLLPVSVAWLTM